MSKPIRHLPWGARAALFLALGATFAPAFADVAPPPVAPVHNTVDTYFGTAVDDPYRDMEDTRSPAVQAWARGQADHARAVLDSIPGRAALLQRIEELDASVPARVIQVSRLPGGIYFYEKRGANENQYKLYVRRGLNGKETLLVDPDALAKATGKPHSINYFTPSPSGRYVTYGLSQSGSEDSSLHLMEVATRKELIAPITRAQYPSVSWLDDDKGFLYGRLQEMKPGMPGTEKYQASELYLHTLDGRPDRLVLSTTANQGLDIARDRFPLGGVLRGTGQAVAIIQDGVAREFPAYIAPAKTLGRAGTPWRKLFDTGDDVTDFAVHGDDLYLITHKNAKRSKLIRTRLSKPDLANAEEIIPAGTQVVSAIGAARDGLYVQTLEATVGHVFKLAWGPGEKPRELALPTQGGATLASFDPRLPGVLVDVSTWTADAKVLAYDPTADRFTNTGLQPASRWSDPGNLVAEEVKVTSHDGVEVPLSIVYPKDIKLDGTNPAILYGYGAYGITDDPFYTPRLVGWYERGGVYATCHVRGGGVYGEEWHLAGKITTKPNTWKDAIACAEYLVAKGYTTPARLAINGGSAGGIFVGRAMTERPDLFAVAVPQVGVMDTVRAEFTPNGVPNISEFGTVKIEEQFRALLEMSSYAHVKPGTAYPATLLTHGINDPRVEPSNSMKMAASLQAATTSGKPVLLRLDYEAGHGIGSTKKQRQQEIADTWSFMLWQFGVPGFQPK